MTGSREESPSPSPQAISPALCPVRLFATDVDGTLTDGGMYYTETGEVIKRFDTRDAFGMNRLRRAGIAVAIVTSEDSPIVLARARKLRIERVYVGVEDKLSLLEKVIAELGATWAQLAYIGDDLNDLPVIERAGLSACPADAASQVVDAANYVCRRAGGHGAVREFCEWILAECIAARG